MGMYSFFDWEQIEVTDKKGLFDWLMKLKKEEKYDTFLYEDYLVNIIDGVKWSFEKWNNIKLISYWYDNQVNFLNEIAKFIKGEVSWIFESHEEHASVKFQNGKTIFSLGNMEYKNYTAKELIGQNNN